MDRLSQELVDHIVSFLPSHGPPQAPPSPFLYLLPKSPHEGLAPLLPPLATVSRAWQAAVERRAFAELSVSSQDLSDLARTLSPRRRRYLRRLEYQPLLPSYDETAFGRYERSWERRANDEAFTRTMRDLFLLLKSWEDDPCSPQMNFAFCLADLRSPTEIDLAGRRVDAAMGKRYDILAARFQHSRVRLLQPESLPRLACIHTFVRSSPSNRYLDLPTCAQVASRLPRLHTVDWGLYDNDRAYALRRRASRDALADEMRNLDEALPLLRAMTLHFFHEDPLNQNFELPVLSSATLLGDSLSSSICAASQNLTSLDVTGVVDARLFSRRRQPDPALPFWPNLKRLVVEFDKVTPSGGWYFRAKSAGPEPNGSVEHLDADDVPTMPHPEPPSPTTMLPVDPLSLTGPGPDFCDEEEERCALGFWPVDVFRIVPDEATLRPLLLAFASAAAADMPLLAEARIGTQVDFPDASRQPWSISWFAPVDAVRTGTLPPDGADPRCCRSLRFQVGDWRPDQELWSLLRDIGDARFGEGLEEVFE